MARNKNSDKSADKGKAPRYRQGLQIDPRLKHRISASAILGRMERSGGPIQILLSGYGGCSCGTTSGGPHPPPPPPETSDTLDGYTTLCMEASLSLKLVTATLKDEGLGILKWQCDINTQVLPNGNPPVTDVHEDLIFSSPSETINKDVAIFDGIGGYCGVECVQAVAHQIVHLSGSDAAGSYVGSTTSLQSVDADRVYSAEVLVVDPRKPMRRARIWLRFLVWKTC